MCSFFKKICLKKNEANWIFLHASSDSESVLLCKQVDCFARMQEGKEGEKRG
jgi:hypothetical protein